MNVKVLVEPLQLLVQTASATATLPPASHTAGKDPQLLVWTLQGAGLGEADTDKVADAVPAEMVTVFRRPYARSKSALVTTEKVAHVEPAGTTTLTGTAASAGLLVDRFTVVSDGDGLLSIMVPTTLVPLPPLTTVAVPLG